MANTSSSPSLSPLSVLRFFFFSLLLIFLHYHRLHFISSSLVVLVVFIIIIIIIVYCCCFCHFLLYFSIAKTFHVMMKSINFHYYHYQQRSYHRYVRFSFSFLRMPFYLKNFLILLSLSPFPFFFL